jgi:hypothetical protein
LAPYPARALVGGVALMHRTVTVVIARRIMTTLALVSVGIAVLLTLLVGIDVTLPRRLAATKGWCRTGMTVIILGARVILAMLVVGVTDTVSVALRGDTGRSPRRGKALVSPA